MGNNVPTGQAVQSLSPLFLEGDEQKEEGNVPFSKALLKGLYNHFLILACLPSLSASLVSL